MSVEKVTFTLDAVAVQLTTRGGAPSLLDPGGGTAAAGFAAWVPGTITSLALLAAGLKPLPPTSVTFCAVTFSFAPSGSVRPLSTTFSFCLSYTAANAREG